MKEHFFGAFPHGAHFFINDAWRERNEPALNRVFTALSVVLIVFPLAFSPFDKFAPCSMLIQLRRNLAKII